VGHDHVIGCKVTSTAETASLNSLRIKAKIKVILNKGNMDTETRND
jgi:hypothetical protein